MQLTLKVQKSTLILVGVIFIAIATSVSADYVITSFDVETTKNYYNVTGGNSNTSADIEAVIGANLSYTRTYNATYDAGSVGDGYEPDTNASTKCDGSTTYLDGDNNCDDISSVYVQAATWTTIDSYPGDCGAGAFVYGLGDTLSCATPPDTNITSWLVDGWNRTDQGNSSAQIEAVIGANLTYMRTYNATYDSNIDTDTDTNMSTAGWLVDGWNRTDQGNTSAEILAVCSAQGYITSYSNVSSKGWLVDGWNRTDQGNTSVQIEAVIGDNLTYTRTYNVTYDSQVDTTVPDTNVTTACGDNQVLGGFGNCITLLNGWNRTDQGNTSAQIESVIGANLTYTRTYNATYDAQTDTDTDTNMSTAGWLVDGWNRTDQGNTSAQIESVIGANLTYTQTYNVTYDSALMTTIYYPNVTLTTGGTNITDNITLMGYVDHLAYNITEGNGVNPLTVYINYTGITSFSQWIVNEYYEGSASHHIEFQLYLFDSDEWETHYDIVGQSGFTTEVMHIYDDDMHIKDGVVMTRFIHIQSGSTSHKFDIDYAWLTEGSDIAASTNLAGYAEYNFASNPFRGTGNFTTTGTGSFKNLVITAADEGWNRTDQGNSSVEIEAVIGANLTYTRTYNVTYDAQIDTVITDTNMSTAGWLVDGWNRTDQGNTSVEIKNQCYDTLAELQAAVGSGWYSGGTSNLTRADLHDAGFNATYVTYAASIGWNSGGTMNNTYNATYDAQIDTVIPDTNVTTACSDNQLLDGLGNCITLSNGWNRTDQGNSSVQIESVIGANLTYMRTYNVTYDSNVDTDTDTNMSTAGWLVDGWNRTDQGNTSAQIESVIGANLTYTRTYNVTYDSQIDTDTNMSTAGWLVDGWNRTDQGNSSTEILTVTDAQGYIKSYSNVSSKGWLVDGWNRTDQGNTSAEIVAVCSVQGYITSYSNVSSKGWLVDGWNRTDQGNTSAQIEAVIGANLTYMRTYNVTYDAQIDTTIPDTNVSTACGDNQLLDGSGSCIGLVSGWNRTDQGNSSAQIEAVIGANLTYMRTYNVTYDTNIDTTIPDTNVTTACGDNQVLGGFGSCITLNNGWNRTDQGNTSVQIEAVIGANLTYTRTYNVTYDTNIDTDTDTNMSTAGWLVDGWNRTDQGNSSVEIEAVIGANITYMRTYNVTYDTNIDTTIPDTNMSTAGWLVDGWNRTDQGNTSAEILAVMSGEGYITSYSNVSSKGWLVDGWNRTDQGNSSAQIEAVIGANLTYMRTYNVTYDTNVDTVIPDTNVTTACGDNQVLGGFGNCITLLNGWNRTDQGNTSVQIEAVIGANLTYTRTYNVTYDANVDTTIPDTNVSTACTDNQFLDGSGSCIGLVDGWNRTDQGNTSVEIKNQCYDTLIELQAAVGSGWYSGGTSNFTRADLHDTGFNATYVTYAASTGWNSGGTSNYTRADLHDTGFNATYVTYAASTGWNSGGISNTTVLGDPWVNTTGDRMTGNLSVTGGANISQVTEILFRGNETRIYWNGTNAVWEG